VECYGGDVDEGEAFLGGIGISRARESYQFFPVFFYLSIMINRPYAATPSTFFYPPYHSFLSTYGALARSLGRFNFLGFPAIVLAITHIYFFTYSCRGHLHHRPSFPSSLTRAIFFFVSFSFSIHTSRTIHPPISTSNQAYIPTSPHKVS